MLYNANTPKADAVVMSSSIACFAIQKMHNSIAQQLIKVQILLILLIMGRDKRFQAVSHDNL